jgi:hypothetical protein
VGVFIKAGYATISALRVQTDRGSESYQQGCALLASLAAIMVAIAAASPVGFVSLMYWCVAGLASGYGDSIRRSLAARDYGSPPYAIRAS